MRGSKLTAWRTPAGAEYATGAPGARVHDALDGGGDVNANAPANSIVPWAQNRLRDAVRHTLAAIAADVDAGLRETVGVGVVWCDGEPASVIVDLPAHVDPATVARAIDLENVEAWIDDAGAVHVGIHPFHGVKDTDQTVLAITKVLHVLYGLHGTGAEAHGHPHAATRSIAEAAAD